MAGGGALAFVLAVWGYSMVTTNERVAADTFATSNRRRAKTDNVFLLNGIADLVGRPFTRVAMEALSPWHGRIRRRIDAAGRPNGMTVESYARQTVGFVVMFGLIGLLVIANGQVIFGVVTMLGALQNEFVLFARVRARQDDIQRTLPDFLDVLAVTVSAGLGFRHALSRVAESMPGALADEFMVALRQMELGTSRREAFEDLRRRNNSGALGQFVTAILQAEELGAPLATALMDIGADMRRDSAQWAKRKAQRTTPRITAVTTALTLPAVMAIVLGSMLFSSGVDLGGLLGR
jgi:tight adherence protein C